MNTTQIINDTNKLLKEVNRVQQRLSSLRCPLDHPGGEGRCIHFIGHQGTHRYPGMTQERDQLWPFVETIFPRSEEAEEIIEEANRAMLHFSSGQVYIASVEKIDQQLRIHLSETDPYMKDWIWMLEQRRIVWQEFATVKLENQQKSQ